jgi:uncharacterized membrane protein
MGSYWVTGADGREYGPVPLETLTRWIGEGRLVATTQVRTEGSGWMEARQVPELAARFAPAASQAPPPSRAVHGGGEFLVWEFIGQAWNISKPHWLPLAGMVFITMAIGCVPYLGACVNFIIGGAIAVGIWRAVLGMVDGRAPEVGMMFSGFDQFGDAFLAYLVRFLLVALGYLCLIVPGIILSVMWAFTFPVLAETRLSFWEAMRRSAVLTEGYRWRIFLLALACFLVIMLGLIVVCVGIFIAIPVCVTAFALAYRWLQDRKGMRHVAGGTPGGPMGGAPMGGGPAAGGPVTPPAPMSPTGAAPA